MFLINGVTRYVTFRDWLFQTSVKFLRFTSVAVGPSILFLVSLSDIPLHDYTAPCHSPVHGHLGGFYLWAIINDAAVNIRVQVSV